MKPKDWTALVFNYLQILPCVQTIPRASHIGMHNIQCIILLDYYDVFSISQPV